jgi:hypothetical protein
VKAALISFVGLPLLLIAVVTSRFGFRTLHTLAASAVGEVLGLFLYATYNQWRWRCTPLAAIVTASVFAIRALADWWLRAKHLERSGQATDPALAGIEARLARIEQAVEATAIEIERIAEAQRFTTRFLAEQRSSEALLPRGQRKGG